MNQKQFITKPEALELLSCSNTFLYELVKDGSITPRKVKGKLYFKVSELEELLENSVPKSKDLLNNSAQ